MKRPEVWLLMFLLAIAGCTGPFGRIEHSIEARLPEVVGPAEAYDVRISRSIARTLRGTVGWLEIDGRNVRPNGMVNLDRVEVRLEGVRVDHQRGRVQEIEEARVRVRVSAASIDAYLQSRNSELAEVRVEFLPNRLRLTIPASLAETDGPLVIEGRPVLAGPDTVNWEASRIATLRDAVPEEGLRKLEEILNPIVDLSRMRFPVELMQVSVTPEGLTVAGRASLGPEQLQGAASAGSRAAPSRKLGKWSPGKTG